jgi:1,4-alpha-glucan branching enzyme
MNNQVIKLRANNNHFGHLVTSPDHPSPKVRQPLTHSAEPPVGKSNQQDSKTTEKTDKASGPRETAKEVSFCFKHASAKKVLLAAEFTEWEKKAIALKANRKDATWKATVALPPGRYRYRFLVDGEWQDDPNASERLPNPFGSSDCVTEVK